MVWHKDPKQQVYGNPRLRAYSLEAYSLGAYSLKAYSLGGYNPVEQISGSKKHSPDLGGLQSQGQQLGRPQFLCLPIFVLGNQHRSVVHRSVVRRSFACGLGRHVKLNSRSPYTLFSCWQTYILDKQ